MKAMREPEFGYAMSQATVLALGRSMASLLSFLGVEVLRELKWFSRAARPGSMITIRRTREGFTSQVTDAIIGGHAHRCSASEIRRMAQNGDSERNRERKVI
jgi:hypothetical protein